MQGTGRPRVCQEGYPSAGDVPNYNPPCPVGGPWGLSRQSPHPALKREDNPPGAERRSAGARRWLRADGSGTSKVISSSNIAFLTHMVKSAWRQLGEVPVVTSV